MWKQIKRFSSVSLCNLFGFNEARFGRDRRKKHRIFLLGSIFLLVGIMVVFYMAAFCQNLARLGMTNTIPAFLCAITGLLIFFFSLFRAGSVIYDLHSYEKEIVLPVRPSVIALSRFFTMYVQDLFPELLVLVPGAAVYAWSARPGISFYLMVVVSTFLLPLLPLAAASILGAAIAAISARVKHHSLISSLFSLALVVVFLLFPFSSSLNTLNVTKKQIAQLSNIVSAQIVHLYPPALLFSNALNFGDWGAFLLFALISAGIFLMFLALIQKSFVSVCRTLFFTAAKHHYSMRTQTEASPLKALYHKELRRYFSSSIYVINTAMGYVLMVVFSAIVLIAGAAKIDTAIKIPGLLETICPMILSLLCAMMPTTSSTISMEGKQWWILQSAPVPAKTIFDSKILVSLTVGLPACVISAVLLWIAIRPPFSEAIWILLLPVSSLLFTSAAGLAINAHFPVFHWENEAVVVKQSAAVVFSMLAGLISAAVPIALFFLLPSEFHLAAYPIAAVVLAVLAILIYCRNNRLDLKDIC